MDGRFSLGIIGCGDFLRVMSGDLGQSSKVRVPALYDPMADRAQRWADELGGAAAASAEAVIDDPAVDAVGIFVPPWARRPLLERAARAGKHILTTKPLAATLEDCEAMAAAVAEAGVQCGVLYRRTGLAQAETLKALLTGGDLGRLALYRQDWLHHFPQWNGWATDRAKNGGPFMDAMIHNLNLARYLMGRPAVGCTYFSENLSQHIDCNDTEFMKLDFEGGSAHLFITWAADLEARDTSGNFREHIDVNYMITDRGWYLTFAWEDGKPVVRATREGEVRLFPAEPLGPLFNRAADGILGRAPWPADLPKIGEAVEDIRLLKMAEAANGKHIQLV